MALIVVLAMKNTDYSSNELNVIAHLFCVQCLMNQNEMFQNLAD